MELTRRQLIKAGGAAAAGGVFVAAPGAAARPAARSVETTAGIQQSFLFGVCGHAYSSEAYGSNGSLGVQYADQVSMLTQLGMDIYRSDIANNADGRALNHDRLLNMHGLLNAAGIQMFPNFYTNYSTTDSADENYDLGVIKGKGLANYYGDMFTHCNLGNELEIAMKNMPGVEESDYDVPRARRAIQRIKGMSDGLKSVYPNIKTSTATAGWFPTWWQHELLDAGAVDFVDWHWYSDMPGGIDNLPAPFDEITNVLDFLWEEFGVPIWVSETNSRADSDNSEELDEQRQVDWFNSFYNDCLSHPHCEAMFIYELLNEPKKSSYEQANFGLVKFPLYSPENPDYTWEWKQLGRQLAGLDQEIGQRPELHAL